MNTLQEPPCCSVPLFATLRSGRLLTSDMSLPTCRARMPSRRSRQALSPPLKPAGLRLATLSCARVNKRMAVSRFAHEIE